MGEFPNNIEKINPIKQGERPSGERNQPNYEANKKSIPLPNELKLIIDDLRYESSIKDVSSFSELPGEISAKVGLKIGKKYLYISRKDVKDPKFVRDYTIPLQVARLEIDMNSSVVDVAIDDKVLASETFSLLASSHFFRKVSDEFNLSECHPSDTLAYVESLNEVADEKNRKAQEIFSLRNNDKIYRSDMSEPPAEQSRDVTQGSILFVNQESPERYIQTIGAGPCIVVVGYDSASKTVGIVHADPFTDLVGSARKIISKAKERVVVLGGQPESVPQLIKLKEFFDENNIFVSEWDILNEVKSIIVDKETGEIYNLRNIMPRINQGS